MNNLKRYAVIAGASAALGGCSTAAHHEAAQSTPRLPSPYANGTAPTPEQVYPSTELLTGRYARIARIALGLEKSFVQGIHNHPVTVKRVLGTCAVIAYKRPGDKDTIGVVAPNPIGLDTLDKETGISISISAAFDPSTRSIIFGPIRTGYADPTGIHTKTLAGQTDETDMFPPQIIPTVEQQTVEWSTAKSQVIDTATGKEAMQIGSFSILGNRSLKDYASDSLSRLVCMAGMQEAGLVSPDSQTA